MLLLAKAAAVCYPKKGGILDVKGVEAMRKALLKWRHFLPWTLLLCLASGCLMAAYTWAYEADRYQAVYTFYAAPDAAASQKAPLEAARMLARDCHALTSTDRFRQAVLAAAASDGHTRAGVRGIDGTHLMEVVAIGPDPAYTAGLANAIGRELVARVEDELGAVEAHEIAPATVPAAPCGPNRPMKVVWTLLAAFAVGSLAGCLLGSDRRPLHVNDPEARCLAAPRMGALADCRREVRRLMADGKKQRGGMLLDRVDRFIRENVREIALKLRNGLCASGQSVAVIAGMDQEGDQAVLTALLCGELARQGFSVLAVDMDAGHARLSGLLGVRPQACLSEYLAGGVSLLDVIVKTPERGLAFIEGLPPEGAVADIAATAAFRSFLKSAKSRFDFVILNAAPAGCCADAGMLGTLEGLTVLAARDGAFTAAELNAVMTNLAEDVRLLKGVVFTMARRTRFDAPA